MFWRYKDIGRQQPRYWRYKFIIITDVIAVGKRIHMLQIKQWIAYLLFAA